MVQFEPGKVSLDDLESLYRHSTHFQIHPGAYPRIADSVGTLSRRIGEGETIYCVTAWPCCRRISSARTQPALASLCRRISSV